VAFRPDEVALLVELERDLRRVEEWPIDSPLGFVIHLAPRTRGKLGELLISRLAVALGLQCAPSRSADFDLLISRRSGSVRTEIKFSTENPPRFQQVRNPRRADGLKYDNLVCVSGRPEGLVYWLLDALEVERYIDDRIILVQHQDSQTNWFFPSRTLDDAFSGHRVEFEGLTAWLLA
jgi:hypothetical protein